MGAVMWIPFPVDATGEWLLTVGELSAHYPPPQLRLMVYCGAQYAASAVLEWSVGRASTASGSLARDRPVEGGQ